MLIADADIDFSVMPNFEFSVNLLVFDDFSQMSICPSFLRLLVLVIVLVTDTDDFVDSVADEGAVDAVVDDVAVDVV